MDLTLHGSSEVLLHHKVASHRLEKAKECLFQLEKFCRNKLLDYLSVEQVYGYINHFIQDVLKEQLFIELLVQVLITSFPTDQNLEELVRMERIRKNQKHKKSIKLEIDRYAMHDNSREASLILNQSEVYEGNQATEGNFFKGILD